MSASAQRNLLPQASYTSNIKHDRSAIAEDVYFCLSPDDSIHLLFSCQNNFSNEKLSVRIVKEIWKEQLIQVLILYLVACKKCYFIQS